jgi:thiol-disulfide isomerase/thioredoxin
MKKQVAALLLGLFVFAGCRWGIDLEGKYRLQFGQWRGALLTDGGELPFLFEMHRLPDSSFSFVLHDGDQMVESDEFEIVGDSFIVRFPVFESTLIGAISTLGDSLQGELIRVKYDVESRLPFVAVQGGKYKFAAQSGRLPVNLDGKWETAFYKDNGDSAQAIGIFRQQGSDISGSFATNFGDYRFLSGIVDGDSLFLSGFDGSGAYLFKGAYDKINEVLTGDMYAGQSKIRTFKARRNADFVLPDPNALTQLKNPKAGIQFGFPNTEGKIIRLSDPAYQGKVVVVQLLGSWCPNCLDETPFLADFHRKYREQGFEVIGLGFERTAMEEKAINNLQRLKKRFNVDYEMLYAGTPDSAGVAKALPNLAKLAAFPTTLIIDKKGALRRIHTGFNGPATGEPYTEYVKEFTHFIESLLAE